MLSWVRLASPRVALVLAMVAGGLGICCSAQAEVVEDVYVASIAVSDRGTRQLAIARKEGLGRVFVKASGDASVLQSEELQGAFDQSERFLLGYSYEVSPEGAISLRLEYDENAVQSALRQAGLPIWTANRPSMLAWLVLDEGAQRTFASPLESPDAHAALSSSFSQRGVPMQSPLYDLQDSAALSAGEAWRFSSASLISASERYRGTELIAGRAARLSNGDWVGDWRLLDQGRWVNLSVRAASVEEFTDAGADLVATTLAGRYAVRSNPGVSEQLHWVTLRGVRSYAAYISVQSALAALETVRRVTPERLLGDQVTLRLEADSGDEQLARLIELDLRFARVPSIDGFPGLSYEWIE